MIDEPLDYTDLEFAYLYTNDSNLIINPMDYLKYKVSKLSAEDRKLIILYAHYNSLRKVGEILGMSHSKVGGELKRIRKLIGGKNSIYK